MEIQFMTSAAGPEGYIESELPEIALAGRSNAGKSSFLNALAGKSVAKASQVPGKTRLLNFFAAGENYVFVDMPGYGFAARAGSEMRSWQHLVEVYLEERPQLAGLVLFCDIRREWSKDEDLVLDFLRHRHKPVVIVLTKADKLSRGQVEKRIATTKRASRCEEVFAVSSTARTGVSAVEDFIFNRWVKKR